MGRVRKELSVISKELTDYLQELPRPGYLWPYSVTRFLAGFGMLKKGRFRYATPGQHNFVISDIMIKKAMAEIIYRETSLLSKSCRREEQSINKRLTQLYNEVESLQTEDHNPDANILREIHNLEKRKTTLHATLREKRLEFQKVLINEFMEIFEKDIMRASRIKDFSDYEAIFADLKNAVGLNDADKINAAVQALAERLVVPPELLSRRVIGRRLGDHELSLLGKFTRELESYKEYRDATANLRDFGRYRKARLLIEQLRREKETLIPPPFVKGRQAVRYELLIRGLRIFFASMVAIVPSLMVYGLGGIPHLPPLTVLWIFLCFWVTYYISWQPSHKISLFVISLFAEIPGHKMITDLVSHIDSNYTEEKPFKVTYITAKKSENESDAEITLFYFRKSISALAPTLETFGRKLLLVIQFWSDTKNDKIIDYELSRLQELSKEFEYKNMVFCYANRSKSEWFDNTKLGMIKTGGFAGKVGSIGNLMHFMNTGQARPYLFTDEGFEFTQDRHKPLLCRLWSNDLVRALGIRQGDGPLDQKELAEKVLRGEDIDIDPEKISEFCVIMDDKNELYPGGLEKALAIMMHPENSHIVLAQPHVAITPPYYQGKAKESIYWKIMKNERDIENEINIRVISGIYGKERAFFGKGFVRTRIYYERVFKPETLSPAKVLSHDWQESIFSRNCEGLLGAKRFVVRRVLDKFGAVTLRIDLANTTRFIKIYKEDGGDVLVYHLDMATGEYRFSRRFHHLKERDIDEIIKYVADFYNNTVTVGERDQLHFVTYIIRDVRWLIGDFQAIRTLISYRKILTPYHQWHLSWSIGRIFSDPALFCFIILMCLLWIFPFILILPTNSTAYLVALAATFFGIIVVHRFIDPIRYLISQARAEGREIRPAAFSVELIDQFLDSVTQTLETTIASLQLTVIKPLLSYAVYKAEKVNKVPEWKTSTMLSLMELEGRITRQEFTDIRINEAQKMGIVITAVGAAYVLTGIAPITVYGLFGILPWAGSLIFGRYAIQAIGKVRDYNVRRITLVKRIRRAYIVFATAMLIILAFNAVKNIPSNNKHDVLKLIFPESRDRYSYSRGEEKLLEKIHNNVKKIEFYIPQRIVSSKLTPVLKTRGGKTKLLLEVEPIQEKLSIAIPILKPEKKNIVTPTVKETQPQLDEPELRDLTAFRDFFAASDKMGKQKFFFSTALAGAKIILSMKFAPAAIAIMATDRAEGLGMILKYSRKYPWFTLTDPLVAQFWFETSRLTGLSIEKIADVFRWEETKKYWNYDFAKKRGIWKRYEHLQRGILSLYYSGLDVNEDNLRKFFAEYSRMEEFRNRYPSIPLKPFRLVPEPVKFAFKVLGTVTFYVPVIQIGPSTDIPYGTILGIVETFVSGKQGKLEYLIATGMKNKISTDEVMERLGFDYLNYAWRRSEIPDKIYRVNRDRFLDDFKKKGVNRVDYERSDIKLICLISDYRMAFEVWNMTGNNSKPTNAQLLGISGKLHGYLVRIWDTIGSRYPKLGDGVRAKGIGENLAAQYYITKKRYGWSLDKFLDYMAPQFHKVYELKNQGFKLDHKVIHEVMFQNEVRQKGLYDDPRAGEHENSAVITQIEKRIEKQSDAGKEMTGYLWLSSLMVDAQTNGITAGPEELAAKFMKIYAKGNSLGYTSKPWWDKCGYLTLIYFKAKFRDVDSLFRFFKEEFDYSNSWHTSKMTLPDGFIDGAVSSTFRDIGYTPEEVEMLVEQTPEKLKVDIAYEFLSGLLLEAKHNGIKLEPHKLASEFMLFYRTGDASRYDRIPWWSVSGYLVLEYYKNKDSLGWKDINDYFLFYSRIFEQINEWFVRDLPLPSGFEYENFFRLQILKRKLSFDPRTSDKADKNTLSIIEESVNNETSIIKRFNAYMTMARIKEDYRLDFGHELDDAGVTGLAGILMASWKELPIKYDRLPLFVPGIVEKIAINSFAFIDYHDVEKAIHLPEINRLWDCAVPSPIEESIGKEIEEKTGIVITNKNVLHYTALQTAIGILDSLGVDLSDPNIVRVLQLRHSIRDVASRYPNLDLLKEGNSEWRAVFAMNRKMTFSELEKRYLKPIEEIYKDIEGAYAPRELGIMINKIKSVNDRDIAVITKTYGLKDSGYVAQPKIGKNDVLVNVAWYHLQRAYDVGTPAKDLKGFFRILGAVKRTNLDELMQISDIDKLDEWQEKMDSISYRLLTIYDNPRSFKRFRSGEDFLYRFLADYRLVRENSIISAQLQRVAAVDKEIAESLGFLWPLWMSMEDIPSSVMENIISKMDVVGKMYREVLRIEPAEDSAVKFNEAVNSYLIGRYGQFLVMQKTLHQRAQSSWWTNYIVKLAYKRLFNENLDESEKTNRRLLKNMQVWFDREKLKNPHKYVLKDMIRDLAENGSMKRIGLFKPVYSGKDEYRKRLSKINGYISRLDAEISILKQEKRYTADLEKITVKAKEDLTELERVPDDLYIRAIEAENLLAIYSNKHNADSIFISAMILLGLFAVALISRLVSFIRGAMMGLYSPRPSEPHIPV